MTCQSQFAGKDKKNIINLSSAEIAQRVETKTVILMERLMWKKNKKKKTLEIAVQGLLF